jgi:hypothetical protein
VHCLLDKGIGRVLVKGNAPVSKFDATMQKREGSGMNTLPIASFAKFAGMPARRVSEEPYFRTD